jgi:predicted GIY-YIG superfamily endonuclease
MKQTLYRFYDQDDNLLYVGITKFFEPRLKQHYKNAGWFFDTAFVRLEHFATRREVELAESFAIQTEKPLYNIAKNPEKVQALNALAEIRGQN